VITVDDVTACLVTRGNVDLTPILESLIFTNVIVWDNSVRDNYRTFGRYMAAREASTRVIYFQDDDMVVPATTQRVLLETYRPGEITANSPLSYRSSTYASLSWLGWGSLHPRGLPDVTFARWRRAGNRTSEDGFDLLGCDIVFSMLNTVRSYDLPVTVLDYAFGDDRAYKSGSFNRIKRAFYDRALTLTKETEAA